MGSLPHSYDPTKIWSTLLTNRGYFGGALVLNHTLRRTGSRYQLKIMVTREVEADTEFMDAFEAAGIPTIVVDKIEPAPRDGKVNKGTWEKLAPWGMTEYEVSPSRVRADDVKAAGVPPNTRLANRLTRQRPSHLAQH